jgi:glycylpeptide N-tetradecanoyltransferase
MISFFVSLKGKVPTYFYNMSKRRKKNTKADTKSFEELSLKPYFPLEGALRAAHEHAFWSTQDVENVANASLHIIELIDKLTLDGLPPAHIRSEPYDLPATLQWCEIDTAQFGEVHDLLQSHYVGSDDGGWIMHYSVEHLQWAMCGSDTFFRLGVRVVAGGQLVGFIAAIPRMMGIYDRKVKMVEINFLCLRNDLRSAGLAPLLIQEITRRVKIRNRWQGAIYTTGTVLPHVMASATCYHRILSVKKMVDIGFFEKHQRLSMKGIMKLYRLPDTTSIQGLRPMRRRDDGAVAQLLNAFLVPYHLRYYFSKANVGKQFRGPQDVVFSYVVENADGQITDFISFYRIEMLVKSGGTFHAAYSLYNVASSVSWSELMRDALVLARDAGCDVFNCTDVMENASFISDLKFHLGTGRLQYYLYNWRAPPTRASGIGIVMT